MAYASWANSDIWFYDSVTVGGLLCAYCNLKQGQIFVAESPDEGLAHLRAHAAAGHRVGDAITKLEKDIADGADICRPMTLEEVREDCAAALTASRRIDSIYR